jgi:hypothetical protein
VREQRQHQPGNKIYSLHAPEVERIGKGKAASRDRPLKPSLKAFFTDD